MRFASRLRDVNPLRLYHNGTRYHRVPDDSPFNLHKYGWPAAGERWCRTGRLSVTKLLGLVVGTTLFLAMVGGGGYRHVSRLRAEEPPSEPPPFFWQNYYPLRGYYNGVRTLVGAGQWEPENRYNQSIPPTLLGNESEAVINSVTGGPSMSPVAFQPYPDYASAAYLQQHQPVHTCYLDAEERVAAPDVYAYPGVPQHMPEAFYGSHKMLGLDDGVCFDRFGRLGPYGYGHEQGGLGDGQASEKAGSEEVFNQVGQIDYTDIDWGDAQRRCHDKNQVRFADAEGSHEERVQRHAYILRAWTGYHWNDHQILTTRAMVNELALKSGGEYDVHILLHVKDNSVPIWADQNVYRQTIEENIPREFWNITTLWSEQLMMMYYPEPFPDNFANMAGSNLHGVYRSAHFALQWFSQQRPEYDFYWNWEMDLRYSGHYYEFNTAVGDWAKKQPRKGLWERSRRFYFPKHHGDWDNFTKFVEQETSERDIANNDVERSGPVPVWGPVQNFPHTGMMAPPNDTIPPTSYEEDNYDWGVGEEADLITFNPIFDPSLTNWVFSWDMSGYNKSLPIPPRRAAIITVARLSKKLLDIMHEETWRMRHTGFPEMWPPTACFHHGLKAVYAPQPVYFDRDWALGYMDGVFNYPPEIWESPFGWGEHNLLGSSFYYNSGFSGALWRRWLGMAENGEGGRREEEQGTGRMCLRGTLHHPIKHEAGPMD